MKKEKFLISVDIPSRIEHRIRMKNLAGHQERKCFDNLTFKSQSSRALI